MRAFLGACMFVVTVVLTWLLMGVVLHAQTYGPPFPPGSFYQKGTIISAQGFGLVGCPTGQFIFGDGTGCGPGPGPGPFVPIAGGTMTGPLYTPEIATKQYPYINIQFWGGVPDFKQSLCSITATQKTLTCTSTIFTTSDAGKTAEVSGAGSGGNILVTTIASYVSGTQVILTDAAITSVTNNYLNMGTDNTTPINNAISFGCSLASSSYTPATIFFPSGKYLTHSINTILSTCSGLSIRGASMYTTALILAPSSTGSLLTLETSGTPSTIQDIGILGAFGGTNEKCLDIENGNGITIAHNWFSACSTNVYINGGSDIQIHDNLSELASANNYEVTNTQSINMHDNVSYKASSNGYYIHDGPTSTSTLHASPILVNNNRDEESGGNGFEILNYNDVMINGAMVESANEQQPVTGILVYASNRVKISQAHITHTGQYGIEVLPSSNDIDIDTPNIDAVGYYPSPASVSMAGIYVTQGNSYINIHGGSITNSQGDCINHQAAGEIYGMNLIDCARGNSSTYGTASIELAISTANAGDTVLVTGNTLQNGTTRGTAILIDSGNRYQIIGNYPSSGFSSTYTNNSAGTGINVCMNMNITSACTITGTVTASNFITGSSIAITSNVALGNGAGSGSGTLTNAPAAGNPTKWIPVNDNGTTRYVPSW